jgi:hypothetical protein
MFWGYMLWGGAATKETGATARESTDEASTPLPAKTGECGMGVVTGAAQGPLHRPRQSAKRRANFAGVTGRREGVRERSA